MDKTIDTTSLKKFTMNPTLKKTLIIGAAVVGTIVAGALAFAAVQSSEETDAETSE